MAANCADFIQIPVRVELMLGKTPFKNTTD